MTSPSLLATADPNALQGEELEPVKVEHRAKPNEKQLRIWEEIGKAKPGSLSIIGYGGAAGGGKTRGGVEAVTDYATDFPGSRILVGRKDFKDLRETTLDQFDLHCPPSLIVRRNDAEHWRRIRLPEWPEEVYSEVLFRELKDWAGLMSSEYSMGFFDEAGEVPAKSANAFLSRLRWTPPQPVLEMTKSTKWPDGKPYKYVFLAASNPWPGWFKDWFVDRKLPEDQLSQLKAKVTFIPALAKDNPHLPENYEAILRATYGDEWTRRFLDGRWDAFEGQVYPSFSPSVHEWPFIHNDRTCHGDCFDHQPGEPMLPHPKYWKRLIGGLDFGGNNPFAHMSAGVAGILLHSNRILLVGEFEGNGSNVLERQMAWMAHMEERFKNRFTGRFTWVADRSQMVGIRLWRRSAFHVVPSKGGWNSIDLGIGVVNHLLEPDASGRPGLYYVPSVEKLPQRLVAYHYDEPADDDSPASLAPVKRNDDLPDALRYLCELHDNSYGDPQKLGSRVPSVQQAAVDALRQRSA